jgi:hypothetical protein
MWLPTDKPRSFVCQVVVEETLYVNVTNTNLLTASNNLVVSDVFVSPPFDGRRYVLTSCSFQAPSNKSLGAVSIRKPTTVPVNPPAAIGYVTCKSN